MGAYFLFSTIIVEFFCQNLGIPVSFSKNKYFEGSKSKNFSFGRSTSNFISGSFPSALMSFICWADV